jgi:ATP-binding cassette subfamily B protein
MEHTSNPLYASTAHRRDKGNLCSLRSLAPYLKPYRLLILGAAIAILFTSAAMLGMGAALRYLVDYGLAQGDPHLLDRGFMILLSVVGLLAAAAYARFYLVSSIGEKLTRDIKRDVFARVMAMDMPYFESTRTGELLSRMTADTQLIQVVLTSTVSTALRNGMMLMGGTVLLMLTSAKLTGFVLLMLPIVITPIIVLGKRVRHWSREAQSRLADVNVATEETLYGIRTIQSFSLEEAQRQLFDTKQQSVLDASLTRIRLRSWLTAIVIGLVFGAVMTVLWMGGRDVLAGKISPGELSSFVFYAVLVAGATGAISDILGELQRAAGASERIVELLAQRPVIASPENPLPLPQPLQGAVSFAGVTFHYPSRPDKPALEHFTLDIRAGEMVAIVGPSGSGKTTALQLLQRFYDPSAGTILLDGVDIRRLSLTELRSVMGLVPQDAVMFSATIAENIGIGHQASGISESDIRHAAELAAALEFIEKLPDGFNSYVGEKGVRLSGGQKQRIAIARALLRNPKILLLDEATSALDAESERLVQQAIAQAMSNRTTLVVAHRLATVQRADRIVVLNEGHVEAIGTHEELLSQSELYANLARLQFMG